MELFSDEYFMKEALKEARQAFEENEVPVGAVIVCNKQIIARAHNMTEKLNDATAHAEMLAITAAENYLGSKYLKDCILYVTLEPCVMCAGASYWTQISGIVYGASDDRHGHKKSGDKLLHPKTKLMGGLMEKASSDLLKKFFLKKR
ncbi:MAG: nucleoside deaminase [Bacteroidales bacterium]|nr:nucleoside deaminase [Bacteroidales bacterium]